VNFIRVQKIAVWLVIAGLAAFADTAVLPRKAPELQFALPGQGPKLLSQYRGKVVALEFIATTCPHCQAASGVMSNFERQYGPRGFQALDVAINVGDIAHTPADQDAVVQNFINQFHVAFPVGYATRDQEAAFMGFSVMERSVVPQIVLIDRNGMIHYQTPPLGDAHSQDETVLRQRIEELLAIPAEGPKHAVRKAVHKST
jgi:thiol-disulfide isomerase/thioredoxin